MGLARCARDRRCWSRLARIHSSTRRLSPVPAGFRVVTRHAGGGRASNGSTLVRDRPPLRVNVARIAPDAAVSLRAVLSNDAVAGPDPIVERTSSMCQRVHCLLAVNGDFAGGDNQPLGGLLTGGELLRTPSPSQLQLSVGKDGTLSAGELGWSGTLVPTDLAPLTLAGVNVAAAPDGLTLYTAAYGPALATPGPATVVGFRNVEPVGALRARADDDGGDHSACWEQPAGGAPEPDSGRRRRARRPGPGRRGAALLCGAGCRPGRSAAGRSSASTPQAGVAESLGGSPILIRDGARWFADAANDFTRGRQPRTLVGWNPAGEKLLVTVDGRQPDDERRHDAWPRPPTCSWPSGRPTASTSTAAGRPPSSPAARW